MFKHHAEPSLKNFAVTFESHLQSLSLSLPTPLLITMSKLYLVSALVLLLCIRYVFFKFCLPA